MLKHLAKNGSLLSRQDVLLPMYSCYSAAKYSSVAAEAASLNANMKPYDDIPGPKQWPGVGTIFSLKQFGGKYDPLDMTKFLEELNNDYGDLVRMKRLGTREIYMFHPEHVKALVGAEGASPMRPNILPWEVYAKSRNVPSALLNSQGPYWKAQRSATNSIMARPQKVVSYLAAQNSIVDEFLELLKNDHPNEISFVENKFEDRLKYLNLELMGLVAFDRRLNGLHEKTRSQELKGLMKDILIYLTTTNELLFSVPIWQYYPSKTYKEFEKASDRIFSFIRRTAQEEYDKLLEQKSKLPEGEEMEARTMLQQFMLGQQKSKLDMTQIVSIMSELLFAAFDSTSINIHYLLYELGRHPEIQDEVYQEIIKNFPKNDSKIDYVSEEMIGKIKLVKSALKESQRLNPLAVANGRVLQQDLVIDNYVIPEGTWASIGFVVMGRSEKYFKDALKFNPKRWTSEKEEMHKLAQYAFMPFGFGARMCIGRRMAEQKIYVFLSKLLKNYKVEYIGKELKPVFRLVNAPDKSLDIKLTRRV